MSRTLPEYVPPPPPKAAIIPARPDDFYFYTQCCPDAQTFTAYAKGSTEQLIFPLPCKRWTCRACAEIKIKRLAIIVQEASPSRLLTLTVDPSLYTTKREAFDATRRCVSVLIRTLRKKFGSIEYLRVTEVTRAGWPHYHLLIQSGFLPHAVVKAEWFKLTGARIVDLRQVTKTWSAYRYLVKYLSKLHKLEWTERHVSMSKGFDTTPKQKHQDGLELYEGEFHPQHPAQFMSQRYAGFKVSRFGSHGH
ncbi:MAG: rolling circle replication-associated protein, partial [Planctomycetota bacterium]